MRDPNGSGNKDHSSSSSDSDILVAPTQIDLTFEQSKMKSPRATGVSTRSMVKDADKVGRSQVSTPSLSVDEDLDEELEQQE